MFKIFIVVVFVLAVVGDIIKYNNKNGRYSIILDTNAISVDAFLDNKLFKTIQEKLIPGSVDNTN